jgi:serine/threonine protein kinase
VEPRPPSFFDSLVGKRIAGRYLVDKLLGSGGMGIVAVARYPELGQKVAIKFLRPELAQDGVISARFMREARVAAKVKSAHFVRVYDVGTLDTGIPYLVMELLTGKDLGDELKARGQLPIADAIDCILQALVGVAEIHSLGIVHRDLKPSNLFIASVAGTTIVKVLDFGISKEKKTESLVPLTSTDHVLGTPQYMSPEQVRASKDVDVRSDIWSLGVILYELVTKTLPFLSEGGGVGEMFGKILYVDPDPPSKHRQDLPDGLEAVILRCITREADQRYASVVELAEALRPFAAAGSLHRIEAVRQASVAEAPEVDDHPILEIGESVASVEGAEGTDGAGAASEARTQGSSPDAKRAELVLAATAVSGPGNVERAPVTAMTSSSVVSSSRPEIVKPAGGGKRLALVALGVVVIGGVVGTLVATRGPAPTATTAGSASVVAEPASANAGAGASATAGASASASAGASAGEAVVAPSAAVPVKPRASANAVVVARPGSRPSSVAVAATATSSAAPKASAPALILDRK